MAYKATDERVDLETAFSRSRSPQSSHAPFKGDDTWRTATKETLNGARAPIDRHSTIWIPAWGGSLNQPVQPKEPQPREFGDPAPLALFTAALTLFIISLILLKTRGVTESSIVLVIAYSYSGFIQVLCGMWDFARGNTFGATVFTSLGGFWISFALFETNGLGFMSAYTTQAELNSAKGFFFISWFMFGVLCTLCTLKSNLATFLLFFVLDLTLLILAIAQFHQTSDGFPDPDLTHLSGVLGLITSATCWYNAMAGLLDKSNSFFTLPVFPFPWTKEAQQKKA
ncbi:GPR1/FUN34/yaaH family-domain-containing protein [Terfezia claveryi]|nr:GPR1/FUN34/yaaH family-domain-containing protein [Terfezia claveryi]